MKPYKCRICGSEEYYQSKTSKTGQIRKQCKACHHNRKSLPGRVNAPMKPYKCTHCGSSEYYVSVKKRTGYRVRKCKPCHLDPVRLRISNLRRKYGLSEKTYMGMWKKQDGKCGICYLESKQGWLGVDHNHKTGVIRGLLCSNCNFGIGSLKDNPRILRSAIKYLLKSD